jgi:hypothetical protein
MVIGQTSLFPPEGKLRDRVELARITVADARHALEKYHYLHRTRTGRQVNYAVSVDGVVDGVITYAYPMMSAPLLGTPSDELIEFARLYLHSNGHNVASCAINQSLRRLRQDWATEYPDAKQLQLCVSWSDTTRHRGIIYLASNFVWVHRTKGRSENHRPGNAVGSKRGARAAHGDYSNDKDCWVYWFDAKTREAARKEAAL